MDSPYARKLLWIIVVLAGCVASVSGVLSGATAAAHPATGARRVPAHRSRQAKTVALLSMARGSFELSLGAAPAWLPLSGTAEDLTLIGGAPKVAHASADNAYVGFVAVGSRCAATPAASRSPYSALDRFYTAAHSASTHAGVFAPNGGAAASTFIDSVSGVVIRQSASTRACVWLAPSAGAARAARHQRLTSSLVASIVVPLLNTTFAASVSNLTGARAGSGGYTMSAFDGGHAFTYRVSTRTCGQLTTGTAQVSAGTPASATVAIPSSPCSTDASSFSFSATSRTRTLNYPTSDALATPPITVATGACELDPLTGATLTQATQYLAAVGCRVGRVEITPFEKSLPRGTISWASVDGGIAELAPAKTAVDLVLNGRP